MDKQKNNQNDFPFFVSIPHSGTQIPPEADWLKSIPPSTLMCDVDSFVDDLYAPALKTLKVPSIIFKWHRYAIDANRLPTDISDFTVERNFSKTSKEKQSSTSKRGPSDIHWYKTTKEDLLIQKALPWELHSILIKKYFNPFHTKIKEQIAQLKAKGHSAVYFLDLHSMPSKGEDYHKDSGKQRKPIVIGDCHDRSCSKNFRELVVSAYENAGFEVALNWPYKGGAITQTYGQPQLGQEVLQVELNRELYIDEKSKNKTENYKKIQEQLQKAITFILNHWEQL